MYLDVQLCVHKAKASVYTIDMASYFASPRLHVMATLPVELLIIMVSCPPPHWQLLVSTCQNIKQIIFLASPRQVSLTNFADCKIHKIHLSSPHPSTSHLFFRFGTTTVFLEAAE